MGERGVYCYTCNSNPCRCTLINVLFVGGIVLVLFAGYGIYQFFSG